MVDWLALGALHKFREAYEVSELSSSGLCASKV